MRIFKIATEDHNVSCDYYSGHVIVANNEMQVRELAIEVAADEGKEVWKTALIENVGLYTGQQKKPFVLLSDFNAG